MKMKYGVGIKQLVFRLAAFSMPKMKRLSTSFMENSVKEVAVTGTSFTPEEVYEDGFFRFSYAH